MKKIFTLLFCVVALGFAANANETSNVDKIINVLLGNGQTTAIMGTNLDVNHDGAITIADVTAQIDFELQTQQANPAPLMKVDTPLKAQKISEFKTERAKAIEADELNRKKMAK